MATNQTWSTSSCDFVSPWKIDSLICSKQHLKPCDYHHYLYLRPIERNKNTQLENTVTYKHTKEYIYTKLSKIIRPKWILFYSKFFKDNTMCLITYSLVVKCLTKGNLFNAISIYHSLTVSKLKPQGEMKSENMFTSNALSWTSPFGLQIATVKMRGLLSIFHKTNNLTHLSFRNFGLSGSNLNFFKDDALQQYK